MSPDHDAALVRGISERTEPASPNAESQWHDGTTSLIIATH